MIEIREQIDEIRSEDVLTTRISVLSNQGQNPVIYIDWSSYKAVTPEIQNKLVNEINISLSEILGNDIRFNIEESNRALKL